MWRRTQSDHTPGRLVAQSRIIAAVRDGAILSGTTEELAHRFDVREHDLYTAVLEMAMLGWLTITTGADFRHTICWVGHSRRHT
jgi:hypothetical protein